MCNVEYEIKEQTACSESYTVCKKIIIRDLGYESVSNDRQFFQVIGRFAPSVEAKLLQTHSLEKAGTFSCLHSCHTTCDARLCRKSALCVYIASEEGVKLISNGNNGQPQSFAQ